MIDVRKALRMAIVHVDAAVRVKGPAETLGQLEEAERRLASAMEDIRRLKREMEEAAQAVVRGPRRINAYHRQSARHAQVLMLQGLSNTEIARAVGVCEETVRQWRIRALAFERRTAPIERAQNFRAQDPNGRKR